MTSLIYWMMNWEEPEIEPTEETVKQRHLVQTQLKNNGNFKLTSSTKRLKRKQKKWNRNFSKKNGEYCLLK